MCIGLGICALMLVLLWFDSVEAVHYVLPAVILMACLGFYNEHLARRERREK
jgi:hypothetical protein